MPVLLIMVIVTATGGLLARNLYADPDTGPSDVVQPSASSVPPEEAPGPRTVRGVLDATEHPLFESVRGVLQSYFDAINDRDYLRWTDTVTRRRLELQPEPVWRASYRSTRDGNIVVYRIELAETDQARVLLRFTSTQDVADAPSELPEPCINWNVVFPLVLEDSGWKIDSGPTTASPQHEACG
ncbi:hypothetical protein BU204_15995 [Actinophytocola xanthii]|uniref:SnoaL-like domain-containing protein n=1 Tax=Actinophytocola xanthii TaxID=1912961 RepID=A0A1Q8CQF8_9PSEU|nr:hypothetical protein BU204_15995 [Actinophytocola xanthii]